MRLLGLAALLGTPMPLLAAATAEPLSLFGISTGKGGSSLSVPLQVVVLLTLMTLLPAVVMCITPFLRITIVLHFLRQALGHAVEPVEPGAGRSRAVSDHRDHAAGGGGHVPFGMAAECGWNP